MTSSEPFAHDPSASAPSPEAQEPASGGTRKKVVISVALIAAGLLIGGAATGIAVASAKGNSSSALASHSTSGADNSEAPTDANDAPNLGGPGGDRDGHRPPGGPGAPGGQELSGDALTKVIDAVAATYSGATVERAFQTPDGGYIAHAITADGEKYVTLDANFAVTGEQSGPGGPGGPRPDGDHGFGPGDGDHGPGDDDNGGITLPSDGATNG